MVLLIIYHHLPIILEILSGTREVNNRLINRLKLIKN